MDQLFFLLIVTSIAVFVKASLETNMNITYVFPDNTCYLSSKPRHINTSLLFIFEYEGKQIPNDCREVALHNADETLDMFKFCITPVSFIDPNCSITVEFKYNERGIENIIIFNCNTTANDTFCTSEETELGINIKPVTGFKNANFTFIIQNIASTKFSYQAVTDVGMFAGIVVGCIIAFLIVVVACYVYIRGRNSNGPYHQAKS
ncbi:uncharacterized protein LOC133195288 [Saccostrea echinata]|uniref:uncharacterized protein LOC133195288 n=1 Tax=Saccostrea echinata TaxID=191078 RepID=UPI002A81C9B0|nr:uncharacterized protein LOC133195288 [Saccostrea echinata]